MHEAAHVSACTWVMLRGQYHEEGQQDSIRTM